MGFSIGGIVKSGLGAVESLGDGFLDIISGGSISQQEALKKQSKDAAAEAMRVAEANAKISRYDESIALMTAEEIRKKAERDFSIRYKQIEKLLSAQKAGFATAGVRIGEGTPIDVMSTTADAAMRDANIEYYENRNAESRARSQAERFSLLAENGLREAGGAAFLTEQAGQNAADNAMYQGYATTAKNTYSIGEVVGWW